MQHPARSGGGHQRWRLPGLAGPFDPDQVRERMLFDAGEGCLVTTQRGDKLNECCEELLGRVPASMPSDRTLSRACWRGERRCEPGGWAELPDQGPETPTGGPPAEPRFGEVERVGFLEVGLEGVPVLFEDGNEATGSPTASPYARRASVTRSTASRIRIDASNGIPATAQIASASGPKLSCSIESRQLSGSSKIRSAT